ncbi:MAG: hypothetical protein WBS22_14525 [Methylocystis sp.]
MKSWKFAIISASLVFAATSASARPARCRIVSNGEKPFNGVCDYMAESGGSFSLSRAKGHKFLEIDPLSVTVLSPGVAEVRGLTKLGVNSRWGAAKRSTSDPACWVGTDFKICVY